jgi:hypothetical protein
VVSVLTGLLCGLIPALAGTRVDLNEALKEAGGSAFRTGSHRAHRLLVISEVALSVVLLVGAGVMFRSFAAIERANLGINPTNVLTTQIALTDKKYASEPSRTAFYHTLLARVGGLPGVIKVGAGEHCRSATPIPNTNVSVLAKPFSPITNDLNHLARRYPQLL